MFEKEFKVMLTEEQYEKLRAAYVWDEEFLQINHYYDTPDLRLAGEHITCRVREIAGEFFLQLKLPTHRDFIRVEQFKQLDGVPETVSAEQLKELTALELPQVKLLGKLATTRSVKQFDGAEIDLDKSEYFGITDYEAEIEFTDEAKARQLLGEITETLGITPNSDVCTGKVRRFMQEYKKASLD